MDFLVDFISKNSNLPIESVKQFRALFTLKSVKKKHILAKMNETPTDFYILKEGIVRSFFTDEKGRELIRSLYVPITSTGALSALILNKPSKISYDCLTDCEVYVGNFSEFKKLVENEIHVSIMYNKILENIFIKMEARIFELSMLNATERYLKVKKEIPNIEKLIPQYHIASFLNITPVQLSRIRRDLINKK
jgi:CRP-like cAMP-binding protein